MNISDPTYIGVIAFAGIMCFGMVFGFCIPVKHDIENYLAKKRENHERH